MTQLLPAYCILQRASLPPLEEGWTGAAWGEVPMAEVSAFRPESSSHRPRTQVRLLHDGKNLRGMFSIDDNFVRSVRQGYDSEVWKDSCVEIFFQPLPDKGYFNLEMNAGGAFLCNHVEDPTRVPGGFKKFTRLSESEARAIQVRSSLPSVIDPERAEPLTWEINFQVPLALLEKYTGLLGALSGQQWRGNFFKCAEENSHPHWASWVPVDEFNFHRPACFGKFDFA